MCMPCLQVYLQWPAGITLMLVAWIATIYGLWQLIELHEIKGRRFNRYHELGQYALGEYCCNAILLLPLHMVQKSCCKPLLQA